MRSALWVLGLWLCSSSVASAETVEFVLDPPIGKELRVVRSNVLTILGDDPSAEPRYVSRLEMEHFMVVTKEEGHRRLASRLTQHSVEVNRQPVNAPFESGRIAQSMSINFAFDDQGQFISTHGLEGMVAKIRAAGVPSELPSQGEVRRRVERQWRNCYGAMWGPLAGRRVDVGSSWEERYEMEVGALWDGAVIPIRERWTVLGREAPEQGGRVHLHWESADDVVPLDEEVAEHVRAWVSERVPELAEEAWASFTLKKQGDLLIDPVTLIEGAEWTDRWHLTLNPAAPSSGRLHANIDVIRKWSN